MAATMIERAWAGSLGCIRAAGIVAAWAIAMMAPTSWAAPGAAAAALEFDGQTAARSIAAGAAQLTGGDLGTIDFAVAPRWAPKAGAAAPGGGAYAQPDATLVALSAVEDLLVIGLGQDETHLQLMNGAGEVATFEVGALAAGGPVAITLHRLAEGGWSIAQGATPLGDLAPDFFDPALSEPVQVEVGGRAFVGVIDGFRIASSGGRTVVEASANGALALVKAFSPRLGIYRQNDAIARRDVLGRLDIVYPRIRYVALVERAGQLGLAFDWGGFLALAPDPALPRRFLPADPRFAWAGSVTFDDASDRFFTASGVAQDYRPAVPLLENGKKYGWMASLAEQPYPKAGAFVPLGSVFANGFPSMFYGSIDGCFDLTDMDPSDFTQTGCNAPIFALPPMESAAYRDAGEHGQIIPFGWRYERRSRAFGDEFSSLVESASEVANGFARSRGTDLSGQLLGIEVESSQHQSVSRETERILKNEEVSTVEQNIGTSHAIILDPLEVRLHHCFIKRVLRMAPGATAPGYFEDEPEFDDPDQFVLPAGDARTDPALRNTGRPDVCPEPFAGPARQELAVADFVELYGTHYAHAIVYGAWGRKVTRYSAESVSNLLAQSSEFEHSLRIGVKAPGAEGEPPNAGGAKFSIGTTGGQGEQKSRRGEGGTQLTTAGWECVGGSSCNQGVPDRGSNLVPVFLDLRTLDGLLSPPYFTDSTIIVDLRRKVRAVIAAKLARSPDDDPMFGAPTFQHYLLEVDELACRGGATAATGWCKSAIEAADLLIYGKLADGRNVDLTPAQNYPVAMLQEPGRSVLFVARRRSGGSYIDQVAVSIAPKGGLRTAGAPTSDGCCGDLVLTPTLCRVMTGERRDCVPVGNSVSCGDYYPVYEDLPCPPFLGPGSEVLAWALRRPQEVAASPAISRVTGTGIVPLRVAGRLGEVTIPYAQGPVERRFATALLQASDGDAAGELWVSGTIRLIDLSSQLGVPRDPEGLSVAFEAPAATTPLIFGPGDPHVYLSCPDGSTHSPSGCDDYDPGKACPAPLARYGRSCVKPEEGVQVAFFNDGLYWASANLAYVLDGRDVEIAGKRLSKGEWQVFSAPRRAEGIVLTGLFHGIAGNRPILSARAEVEQGPGCFFVVGSAFDPKPDFGRACREFGESTGYRFNGVPLR